MAGKNHGSPAGRAKVARAERRARWEEEYRQADEAEQRRYERLQEAFRPVGSCAWWAHCGRPAFVVDEDGDPLCPWHARDSHLHVPDELDIF